LWKEQINLSEFQFDEIGYWSEVKLEIIKRYGVEYSKILTAKGFDHFYIDAFAGGGHHIAKSTNELVLGSPLNALAIKPPFKEIFLIDLEPAKASRLREVTGDRKNLHILEGDCNKVLLETVFPNVRYEKYRRALCVLDPYGLHLNWKVIETAGRSRAIEIFLNFPVADINRNVLWNDPTRVSTEQAARLTMFWGDESWKDVAYSSEGELFGHRHKEPIEVVAEAFRNRLQQIAGFKFVPQPLPMRNSRGAIVYYLYFASPNKTADKIVRHIFGMFRDRGVSSGS
jgi:three-Cys-motif partner protein